MNYRSIFAASAALLLSSAAANAAQVAALIGGDTIATVDTAQKKATGSVKVTGISGALVGIDVRPADGMLYGLVDDGTIVTIATDGKATVKSKLDTMLAKGVAATVDFIVRDMPAMLVSSRRPAITAYAWPGFVKTVIHAPLPRRPHFMKEPESSGACTT